MIVREWEGRTKAAQSASAAVIAASRSEPGQVFSMQVAVLSTKAEFLQRQALSVSEQPPRSADAIHAPAQAGEEYEYHGLWNVQLRSNQRTRDVLATDEVESRQWQGQQ